MRNRLQNGAQQAQPSGGGFWNTIGNIFQGISQISFPSPSSQQTNYSSFLPSGNVYQQQQKPFDASWIVIGVGVFALLQLIKNKKR
jgi:hypothetical protein